MDGNQIAAHFIRTTSWEKLPAEVCQKAKTGLLDNLGCMIAGSQARISRVCRDYMDTVWPQGDEASIVMQGCKSSLFGAAFVNANTANATDMDDDGLYCDGHPGAQLVPVTLALAEKYCLSGKELLSALVVGYEVAHRVGACWHDDHEMKRLGGRQPRTEEEAQFNVAWPLAVYLQYGEISPHHMLEKNLSDKKLIALAEKINVTESEDMNRAHRHDSYPCRVEIFLHDGRCLDSGLVCYQHSSSGGTDTRYGDYTRHADVAAKFMHITAPVLDYRTAQDLLKTVENIDSLESLAPFIALWAG